MTATQVDERGPESQRSLRTRILEAATELFAERGYAATSMREVALAAHCTKPALYYHFTSKSALFVEAIGYQAESITQLIQDAFAKPGRVRARMQRAMEAYFDHVRAHPVSLRLLLRAEVNPEAGQPPFDFRSARQTYIEMTLGLIDEGVASGEIRAGIHPMDAMHALAGVVDHRCMMWILEGDPIPQEYPARVIDLLFEGMSP
jgi:AcrR family transcriptional regulator